MVAGLVGRLRLLAGAALRVLELTLADLVFLAFRFADDKGSAAQILRLIQFVFCQSGSPVRGSLSPRRQAQAKIN